MCLNKLICGRYKLAKRALHKNILNMIWIVNNAQELIVAGTSTCWRTQNERVHDRNRPKRQNTLYQSTVERLPSGSYIKHVCLQKTFVCKRRVRNLDTKFRDLETSRLSSMAINPNISVQLLAVCGVSALCPELCRSRTGRRLVVRRLCGAPDFRTNGRHNERNVRSERCRQSPETNYTAETLDDGVSTGKVKTERKRRGTGQ